VSAFRVSLSRFALRLNGMNQILQRFAQHVLNGFQNDTADNFSIGGKFYLQIFVAAFFADTTVAFTGNVREALDKAVFSEFQ
jgi:hypothetical protein